MSTFGAHESSMRRRTRTPTHKHSLHTDDPPTPHPHCRCVCVTYRPIVGFSMKLDCAIDMIQLRRPKFHLRYARSLSLLVIIGHTASIDSELDRRALGLAAFEAMTDHEDKSQCQEEQDDWNDNSDDDRSWVAAQLQPKN